MATKPQQVDASNARDDLAAKINSHQAQIEDWRREMSRIDQFIEDYHRSSGFPISDNGEALGHEIEQGKRRTTGNSSKEEVSKAAREIIAAGERPMPCPILSEKLRARGLVIEGAEPQTVLSTMLWRTREEFGVVHLKGQGYLLGHVVNSNTEPEPEWPVIDQT